MTVDRTRKFTLPGIHELNKDQDAALALPQEGQHLIIGGPGTGKSVVALLRVRKLVVENKHYRFLVYNHLLDGSNRHLFGTAQDLISSTWEKWFRELYRYFYRSNIPTLEPDNPGGYRAIDWASAERQNSQSEIDEKLAGRYFLVIDEGQDMPPPFYRMLIHWGLENFYIVADQNQQMHPDKCSSRQDIESVLVIENRDTLELKANYRNTFPIALLAQHFYPADLASPKPDLPEARPAMTPEAWSYGSPQSPAFSDIISRILILSDRNPRKLIGVITPDNKIRGKYVNEFNRINPALDYGKPPIQTYASGNNDILKFDQGGIMVINAQSCKGLEFDTVILADIDMHQPKDIYTLKSRFYVMVTRAREHVILLRTGKSCPVVDSLLPLDENILSRK